MASKHSKALIEYLRRDIASDEARLEELDKLMSDVGTLSDSEFQDRTEYVRELEDKIREAMAHKRELIKKLEDSIS
jgi:hypothetical protein